MPTFRRKPIDIVIDVRSRLEFWLGHLAGATCIPLDRLAADLPKRADVSPTSRILLYCASGARSAAAAAELASMGYRNVTDGGGMAMAQAEYSA